MFVDAKEVFGASPGLATSSAKVHLCTGVHLCE